MVWVTLDPTRQLCGPVAPFFSFFLFFVPLVGGIYPKQTSTDGYLEIEC